MRQHLESERRQSGFVHQDLLAECPEAVEYLWSYHLEISARRTSGEKGRENPISIAELESWMRITGVTLEKFELEALNQLDAVHLSRGAQ